jgi:hypothetical protein
VNRLRDRLACGDIHLVSSDLGDLRVAMSRTVGCMTALVRQPDAGDQFSAFRFSGELLCLRWRLRSMRFMWFCFRPSWPPDGLKAPWPFMR